MCHILDSKIWMFDILMVLFWANHYILKGCYYSEPTEVNKGD